MGSFGPFEDDEQTRAAWGNTRPIRKGDKGSGVGLVQSALADVGQTLPKSIGKGAPDGVFGDETLQAVKDFQKRAGLKDDGIVGPKTLDALAERMNDRLHFRLTLPSRLYGLPPLGARLGADLWTLPVLPPSPLLRLQITNPLAFSMRETVFERAQRMDFLSRYPAPGPANPGWSPGAGPDKPRPGEVGDVLSALAGLPVVKNGLNNLLNNAETQFKRGWNASSGGEKGLIITYGVLFIGVGGGLAIANKEPFNNLLGKDIPIPRFSPLKFRLDRPDHGRGFELMLKFDVGHFLPDYLGFGSPK